MKLRESPELKQERSRAGALGGDMRESLDKLVALRGPLEDRRRQQSSTWKDSAPHSTEDEAGFIERLRVVNLLYQEINESRTLYLEEKQTLNGLLTAKGATKEGEQFLSRLRRLNDICELELETEVPKQFELLTQLEDSVIKLEEYVAEHS